MTQQSKVKEVAVTLQKSLAGRKKSHQSCARGLGLRRIRHCVKVSLTPENEGMLNEIRYLVSVEESA